MPYKDPEKRRQWWVKNCERVGRVRRSRYRTHSEHFRTQAREGRLKSVYGMPRGDYALRLSEQGGVCAICGEAPAGRSHVSKALHVDHDHATGAYRALLCNACNHGIGHFRDSAALCRAAAAYLEKHGARSKPPEMSTAVAPLPEALLPYE